MNANKDKSICYTSFLCLYTFSLHVPETFLPRVHIGKSARRTSLTHLNAVTRAAIRSGTLVANHVLSSCPLFGKSTNLRAAKVVLNSDQHFVRVCEMLHKVPKCCFIGVSNQSSTTLTELTRHGSPVVKLWSATHRHHSDTISTMRSIRTAFLFCGGSCS